MGVITSDIPERALFPAGSFVTPERARPRPYASPHAQVGATFYETDRTRAVSEADLLAGKVDPAIGGSCGPIPKDWAEHDGTPAGATRPCAERLGMTRARRPSTYSETDRSVAVSEAGRARRATAIRLGSSERLWAAYDCLAHKSGRSSPATFLNAGHTPFIRRRTASGILAHKDCCTSCWFPKLALRGRNSSQSLFLDPKARQRRSGQLAESFQESISMHGHHRVWSSKCLLSPPKSY